MTYNFGACKDSVIMAKEKEIEDIDNISDKTFRIKWKQLGNNQDERIR